SDFDALKSAIRWRPQRPYLDVMRGASLERQVCAHYFGIRGVRPRREGVENVHRHESVQGEEGRRTRFRAGLALARDASRKRAGLHCLPPSEGPRARGPRALCLAFIVAL